MWYVLATVDGEEITVYQTQYRDAAEIAAASFPAPCEARFVPDNWNEDENRILFMSAKAAIV